MAEKGRTSLREAFSSQPLAYKIALPFALVAVPLALISLAGGAALLVLSFLSMVPQVLSEASLLTSGAAIAGFLLYFGISRWAGGGLVVTRKTLSFFWLTYVNLLSCTIFALRSPVRYLVAGGIIVGMGLIGLALPVLPLGLYRMLKDLLASRDRTQPKT